MKQFGWHVYDAKHATRSLPLVGGPGRLAGLAEPPKKGIQWGNIHPMLDTVA